MTTQTPSDPPPRSVIIIGTGWYGLSAAKTYLQINPAICLTILDQNKHIGGVWSRSKIYPELIADSPLGAFEFSDECMKEGGADLWSDISGDVVAKYLEGYVRKWGLEERIRLGCRVLECREVFEGRGFGDGDGGVRRWDVEVLYEGEGEGGSDRERGKNGREVLRCDKLIIATGLTSIPSTPKLNTSSFKGLVIHSADLGARYQELKSQDIQNVVVVGGNKSAAEIVNLCALQKKNVHWLIRRDGSGPGVLVDSRTNGVHAAQIAYSRWSGIPNPNLLHTTGFWYWFLHSGKSRLGLWLTPKFWELITRFALKDKYERSENGRKLKPDLPDFLWSTSGAGALPDNSTLMEMVDEGKLITVHRDSIISLSEDTATLLSNETPLIAVDALIFATGWSLSQSPLFNLPLRTKLGLPIPISQQPPSFSEYWSRLDNASEEKINSLLPILRNPPKTNEKKPDVTQTRLWRETVPIDLAAEGDRSIIFLGCLINAQVSYHAEVSALWGISYLEGLFDDCNSSTGVREALKDKERMDRETSEIITWMRKRYRRNGIVLPDADVEPQCFIDLMMKDLGLRVDRRRASGPIGWFGGLFGLRGWWREWFQPYLPGDYRGIAEEFLEIVRGSGKDKMV